MTVKWHSHTTMTVAELQQMLRMGVTHGMFSPESPVLFDNGAVIHEVRDVTVEGREIVCFICSFVRPIEEK